MIAATQLEQHLQVHGGGSASQLDPAAASALLDQLIEETAIVEAEREGGEAASTEPDPGVPDATSRAAAVSRIAATVPPATDAQIDAYYRQHRAEFMARERRKVRQILVREPELAQSILAELRGGLSFEDAARRYSRAPNAPRGGEVGWVERGQLPRLFEDTIFSLPEGGRSAIVRTDGDFYHLFQVDQIATEGEPSFEQVRPIIQERLREEEVRRRIQRRLNEMTEDGLIRVWPERLPFDYTGRWAGE